MAQDLRIEIMQLLLEDGEDLAVREIARRLNRPPGHVFYHLKKLHEMGILCRDKIEDRVYYTPQNIFTKKTDETIGTINELSKLIKAKNGETIANCIMMFLKCYDSTNIV